MLTINKVSSRNDLYCHYEAQTEAQPCYIELDCENETLTATYNGEIGNAVPHSVFHGHDQRFGIPCITADAANELLEEIKPLAERVLAGYTSEWDGNNHVAVFNEDATTALDEITQICDEYEADEHTAVQAWNAADWLDSGAIYRDETGKQCKYSDALSLEFEGIGKIDKNTTDEQLIDISRKLQEDAGDAILIEGLDRYLENERENCITNASYFDEEEATEE